MTLSIFYPSLSFIGASLVIFLGQAFAGAPPESRLAQYRNCKGYADLQDLENLLSNLRQYREDYYRLRARPKGRSTITISSGEHPYHEFSFTLLTDKSHPASGKVAQNILHLAGDMSCSKSPEKLVCKFGVSKDRAGPFHMVGRISNAIEVPWERAFRLMREACAKDAVAENSNVSSPERIGSGDAALPPSKQRG